MSRQQRYARDAYATAPAYPDLRPSLAGSQRPWWWRPVGLVLASLLIGVPLGGIAGAYVMFTRTINAPLPAPRLRQVSRPVPPAQPTPLPRWTGRERVNILVLGTDQRDGEQFPPRTDTIIVLTLDPVTKTAGMLSLPRDLWVPIPGVGNNRINVAYTIGGVPLAQRTVEQFIGVPLHHYAVLGFGGFTKLVDLIGGVVVDVPRPIKDDAYPDGKYGIRRIFLHPGLQRMDGETALWYARTRHADSDYHRARRQQQLLLSLKESALQPHLWRKAPRLLSVLSDSIRTDLRLHEVLGLAIIAKDIAPGRIVHRVIDESMATTQVMPNGAQVEVPNMPAIRAVVREVFADGRLVAEGARIEIQNAANQNGLAGRTAAWLRSQGINVERITTAPATQAATTLTDYSGKDYTRRVVAQYLKIAPRNVHTELGTPADIDIRVTLGQDFVLPRS